MCMRVCVDVDECELMTHNCHEFARCINTVGKFGCECLPFFEGNGWQCTGHRSSLQLVKST